VFLFAGSYVPLYVNNYDGSDDFYSFLTDLFIVTVDASSAVGKVLTEFI